jgi:hypothetical protein
MIGIVALKTTDGDTTRPVGLMRANSFPQQCLCQVWSSRAAALRVMPTRLQHTACHRMLACVSRGASLAEDALEGSLAMVPSSRAT